MTEYRGSLLAAAIATASGAMLAACIVVPAQPPYVGGPVIVAPPAPQMEVIGVAPGPGYFWIGGYWNWVGSGHVWTGGHWESHRPGHYWVPHQWHRDGSGWHAAPGRWERRWPKASSAESVLAKKSLATAATEPSGVVVCAMAPLVDIREFDSHR